MLNDAEMSFTRTQRFQDKIFFLHNNSFLFTFTAAKSINRLAQVRSDIMEMLRRINVWKSLKWQVLYSIRVANLSNLKAFKTGNNRFNVVLTEFIPCNIKRSRVGLPDAVDESLERRSSMREMENLVPSRMAASFLIPAIHVNSAVPVYPVKLISYINHINFVS